MMHEFCIGHSRKKSVLALFWVGGCLKAPSFCSAGLSSVLLQFQEGELGKVKKWGRGKGGSENCVTECFLGHTAAD